MSSHTYKVIIIGAGISGLSACQRLVEAGVRDILLLEANNRVGGRIQSVPYQNAFLDLGAQWITGRKGNQVYEFAKSLNLIDDKTKTEFGDTIYATQDGTKVNQNFAEKMFNKIEKLYEKLEDDIEDELDERRDKPFKVMLDDEFEALLRKLKNNEYNLDVELVRSIYRARLNDEKFDTACENLNELSALGWNEYEDYDGEHFINLKSGYGRVTDALRSQIPNEVVHLSEPVELINWMQASTDRRAPIEVKTFHIPTNTRYVYRADKVLCTVPLGFLKANHQYLFSPRLPTEKTDAIERLGFGCVDKIFLFYDKPVLKPDDQGLMIFWRDDVRFQLDPSIAYKWNIHNENFLKIMDNYNVHPLLPNVMSIFVVGHDAFYIESLPDECLLDVFTDLLRKCFPHLNLPRPSSILRSKWGSNEFIRGSYSYIKMGSTTDDCKTLSKTINQKLFFAGEATQTLAYGSAHGAFASGRSAAQKILQAM